MTQTTQHRTCKVCGQDKPEHAFPLYGYGTHRRQPCKACWSKREVKRQQARRAERTQHTDI